MQTFRAFRRASVHWLTHLPNPHMTREASYLLGTTYQLPGRPGVFWVIPKNYPGGRVILG